MPDLILPRKNRLRWPRYVGFASSPSDLSSYTFSGWSLRRGLHAICFSSVGLNLISSISATVNGSPATSVVGVSSGLPGVASIFTFNVPADGTYSIVVTLNATMQRMGCGVYDLTGFNATAVDSEGSSTGASATSRTVNVNVLTNGILIAVAALGDSTVSHSYSAGISTTRTNADMDTTDYALIGDTYPTTVESNRTVTVTRGNSGTILLSAASFSP